MSQKVKLLTLFKGEQYQALHTALVKCAEDSTNVTIEEDDMVVYTYLDDTPQASLVSELVMKLNEMGYSITPTK
jgi:hypothetical protein